MISHDNAVWVSKQIIKTIDAGSDDEIISYLPLSHIAEQIVSLHSPYIMGATVWFAEASIN